MIGRSPKPNNRRRQFLMPLALTVLLSGGCGGYGKVSDESYEVATALYGACLARSEERLNRVAALLNGAVDGKQLNAISDQERKWLEDMIARARRGDWEAAAKSAKRMMEDQVRR